MERPKPRWLDAPLEVASGVWRPIVEPKPGQVDHRAYTLCALERLRDAGCLRQGEPALAGSEGAAPGGRRMGGGSLRGVQEPWALGRRRGGTCAAAGGTGPCLAPNGGGPAHQTALAIEERGGRAYVRLTPLQATPEPASFVALKKAVTALMPKVDLPDVILEVASWTGFPDEFTHVSEGEARVDDLWGPDAGRSGGCLGAGGGASGPVPGHRRHGPRRGAAQPGRAVARGSPWRCGWPAMTRLRRGHEPHANPEPRSPVLALADPAWSITAS